MSLTNVIFTKFNFLVRRKPKLQVRVIYKHIKSISFFTKVMNRSTHVLNARFNLGSQLSCTLRHSYFSRLFLLCYM